MTERTRALAPIAECKPPLPFPLSQPPSSQQAEPLLNSKGKRADGRDRDQLRQICMSIMLYIIYLSTWYLLFIYIYIYYLV